jgi:hypothetical protein
MNWAYTEQGIAVSLNFSKFIAPDQGFKEAIFV